MIVIGGGADRPRDGLGVVAARRRGAGGRDARPHRAGHGPPDGETPAAGAGEAGARASGCARPCGSAVVAADGVTRRRSHRARRSARSVCDVLLVAVGRRPYTEGLGARRGRRRARRARAHRGRRSTSPPTCRASSPSATSSPARCWRTRRRRKASPPSSTWPGCAGHVNYDAIPNVVYTRPELAARRHQRGRAQAAGPAGAHRRLPVHGQRAAPRHGGDRGPGEGHRRRSDRPRPRRPHPRPARLGPDRRGGAGHGVLAPAPRTSGAPCTPTHAGRKR